MWAQVSERLGAKLGRWKDSARPTSCTMAHMAEERDRDLWASGTVEKAAGKAEESLSTRVRLVALLGASPTPPPFICLVHQLCASRSSHSPHRHFIPAPQPSLETGSNFSDEKTRLREIQASGVARKTARPQRASRARLSWCSSFSSLHGAWSFKCTKPC